MDATSTPKSSKKSVVAGKQTTSKKQIKLPYNENNLFVPADQLTKIPRREDDQWAAGDLVWCKTKGFPWWPCLITVDPETGKYSKTVVIRDKNDKAFHVQYFGSKAYRGYTQGNIMKYEGKEKYELKLDQIKNTPTPNKSQRKMELNNYEIKHTYKKDWNLACGQADDAMKLDRASRIETLTFEYILDKPKSVKKRPVVEEDEEDEVEMKSTGTAKKSKISSTNVSSTTGKKRKAESQQPASSKAKATSQSTKRSKKAATKSSPTDVYDFNEFADEFQEDVTPSKKPFDLSSAKRAKGEYSVYAKQLRADIERENPNLDEDEVEAKLKRNWDLMSEDMRNGYAPRPSLFQSNLSFQLESPDKHHDKSLNDTDLSIPDLNNSTTTKSRKQKKASDKKAATKPVAAAEQTKTYSGLRRGSRRSKVEEETSADTNGNDEKENAVEAEDVENEDNVEENCKDEEQVISPPTTNRSSSRKKVFNQDVETNEAVNENTTNNTPKRSARMRSTRSSSTELSATKTTNTPSTKSPSVKAPSSTVTTKTVKTPTPSTRTSTRSSSRHSTANSNENNTLPPPPPLVPSSEPVEETISPAQENTIKTNSIKEPEAVVVKSNGTSTTDQLTTVPVEETNGISEDSVSCSSESEKTEQQQKEASEESKEKHCAKCLESDKGLIRCDGDCLSYYHRECLHQTS